MSVFCHQFRRADLTVPAISRGRLSRYWIPLAFAMLAALLTIGAHAAQPSPLKASASYYADSRGFTSAAIATSSNALPLDLSFWGFTDFHGDQGGNSLRLTRAFSEYRLTYSGISGQSGGQGLNLQAEYNAFSGRGNDLIRLGLMYKHKVSLPWLAADAQNGWLQWRAFPYESDNNGAQASFIFFLPLTRDVHFKGFADYNVIDGGDNRWVIEPEIAMRLSKRWWALFELRYNQYEDANPTIDGTGIALGVRFDFTN